MTTRQCRNTGIEIRIVSGAYSPEPPFERRAEVEIINKYGTIAQARQGLLQVAYAIHYLNSQIMNRRWRRGADITHVNV